MALVRNTVTEALAIGDVILTRSLTGLAEEILTITVEADRLVLTTQPASLREVFQELDFTWIGEGIPFKDPAQASPRRVFEVSVPMRYDLQAMFTASATG